MAEIRHFCFRLGGHLLALPVQGITEVIPRVLHEVIPEQPEGVLGVVNYHGHPLVLLDTASLLGTRYAAENHALHDEDGRDNYLAVMETSQGLVGLLLDGLEGVQSLKFESKALERILPKDYPVRPRLVSGMAYHDGRPVFVLDPAQVFSAEQMAGLARAFQERESGAAPTTA